MPEIATPAAAMLIVERPFDGVLLIRLSRPESRNALATPLLQQIAAELSAAEHDKTVRAVVITGSDTVFAAGADLNELALAGSDEPMETPRWQAWAAIHTFTKPLIAAVEGWCVGAGSELMLRCDLVVAAKSAKIGQPETSLGIMPGAGGTAILPRRVGFAWAMDMVLLGEPMSGSEAFDRGLVSRLTEEGAALSEALELAKKLAARAPLALRAAKASLWQALELPLSAHLAAERRRFISLLDSTEKREGLAAFKEKRKPVWRGR